MAVELVKSIKETEERAQELVREAQQEARKTLKEAQVSAEKIMESAVAQAEEEARESLNMAEKEAKAESKPLLEKQEDDIEQLKVQAAKKMPEAVALIKNKVVKTDANH